ncbi:MAG: HAD family hydrolase [Atopobiaceae bacterium]
MTGIDLVAFDLDGTTINNHRPMTRRVADAFAAAKASGAATSVVSGRPTDMLGALLDADWLDWRITVNGACVTDARTGEVRSRRPLAYDDALEVLATGAPYDAAWNVFLPDGSYFERKCYSYMVSRDKGRRPSLHGLRRLVSGVRSVGSAEKVVRTHRADVDKIGASFPSPEACQAAAAAFASRGDLEVVHMGPDELELTRAGVTKGSALGELCRASGIDVRRAVVFGDSGNDISLTGRPCTFVAVANATPEIAAAADDHCPSVDDDGVAQWIEARL